MRKYFFLIAAAVLLLDRLAKWAVASNIPLHDSVTVIPGFFHLTHVENTGAAFGLFAESTAQWKIGALVSFSVIALMVVSALLWKHSHSLSTTTIGLSLILGGATGNLWDRMLTGHVVELDFYVGSYHWPANADRTSSSRGGLRNSSFGAAHEWCSKARRSWSCSPTTATELRRGRLTARVPQPATGFALLSPHGKLIDLGTEFGVSVDDAGAADVVVFAGQVKASPTIPAGTPVELKKGQEALLDKSGVVLQPARAEAEPFVRAITAPPVLVPRTTILDFRGPVDGSIRDAAGQGTGLTRRLPGTGAALPADDPNLTLDVGKGRLRLRLNPSNLNKQRNLDRGEYLGVRLADLGFTGEEDFSVTATVVKNPCPSALGGAVRALRRGAGRQEHPRRRAQPPGGEVDPVPGSQQRRGGLELVHDRLVGPGGRPAAHALPLGREVRPDDRESNDRRRQHADDRPGGVSGRRKGFVRRPVGRQRSVWQGRGLVVKEFKVTVWTRSP